MPFPSVLCDELAALMVGKGRDDLVFTNERGGVLRNSNWRARVFRPAVAKCQAADDTSQQSRLTTSATLRRASQSARRPM